jgi:hypothetical protein
MLIAPTDIPTALVPTAAAVTRTRAGMAENKAPDGSDSWPTDTCPTDRWRTDTSKLLLAVEVPLDDESGWRMKASPLDLEIKHTHTEIYRVNVPICSSTFGFMTYGSTSMI